MLQDLLATNFGLDLTGGTLSEATGISADGRTIVGFGTNPDDFIEAWIATLPPPTDIPTVSEGGIVAMALLILTAGTLIRMRRRPARA